MKRAVIMLFIILGLIAAILWQGKAACEDDLGGTYRNFQCTVPPTPAPAPPQP